MPFDHSKPETKELYRREVDKRVELGMPRDKAEMLVAVLMWDGPTKTEDAELAK